jgi:N-acetylneuraminate synthase
MNSPLQLGALRLLANRPFIIAEAGVNHENSLDTARRMVEAAAQAGADAIKFQSYKADTLASRHSPSYWDLDAEPTRSQYDLFKKFDHFNDREYELLAQHAASCGIVFLSTPFDVHFAESLAPLMPAYKIASADLTNLALIRRCAAKGKPMILSVGAAEPYEIDAAVLTVRSAGNPPLALLHCVLAYPCKAADAHLNTITYLQNRYPNVVIGYSDHVPPGDSMLVPFVAWLLGARIIEKHFTLDKTLPGNDHYHAMDAKDLHHFRELCETATDWMGEVEKKVWPCEAVARDQARRSLVASRPIAKGEPATEDMVAIKRPGTGIPPAAMPQLLGWMAVRDIDADEILQWDMFVPARSGGQ